MAISVTELIVHQIPSAGAEINIGVSSADVTGGEEILAAVPNSSHYIRKIFLKCCPAAASVVTVTLLSGSTEVLELVPFSGDAGAELTLDFGKKGIKFGLGEAVNFGGAGAGVVFAYIEGRTCKLIE